MNRVSATRSAPTGGLFKTLRILLLLMVLLGVSVTTCTDRLRSTSWRAPLYVAVYPIADDESPITRAYLDSLDAERFKAVDGFFIREGRRYGLAVDEPVKTRLRAELKERPPQRSSGAGVLGTMLWSLELRYWAWRVSGHTRDPEDVRIFVLFRDPALSPVVPHSLGLTKGLIGVVYAFAAPQMNGENNVVIAHELMHTVGATDKYDTANDMPRFPDGYGDPNQRPLYPQQFAEIMAGRRMLSPDRWEQAADLDEVVVGRATALEIRWPKAPTAIP